MEFANRRAAAALVQQSYRTAETRAEYRTAIAQIVRVQALWRGRQVRAAVDAERRAALEEALRRLREAKARAREEQELGYRTRTALRAIGSSRQLQDVVKACHVLELSTRYAVHCRQVVARHRAIPVLLQLIRSCNRSQPHQSVIRLALQVVDNMARCPATINDVFAVGSLVDTLVELMQVYRTTPAIFLPAADILVIFARRSELRAEIRANRALCRMLVRLHDILKKKASLQERYGSGAPSTAKPRPLPPREEEKRKGLLRSFEVCTTLLDLLAKGN